MNPPDDCRPPPERDDPELAALLEELYEAERFADCLRVGAIDRLLDGDPDPDLRARADAHAARCDRCRAILDAVDADAPRRPHGAIVSPQNGSTPAPGPGFGHDRVPHGARIGARRRAGRWATPLAWAAGLLLFAGAAIFITRGEQPELTPKGGGAVEAPAPASDRLEAAILRDDAVLRMDPLTRLREGDILRLFHTAPRPGHLVVVNLDAERRATVLFPHEGAESSAIEAGAEVPLVGGVLVSSAPRGCEWIVGVFSDDPLGTDAVRDALADARVTGAACGLEVDVPGARSIVVVPIGP